MTAKLTRRNTAADKFPVRWTIEIGTHPTVQALVADTEAGGAKLGVWARALLPKVTVSPVRQTLRLVAPSVAELGFTEATPLREIHAQAIETFGLALSPSEAAFQLRCQYTNQPKGEWLLMAMEALEDSGRDLSAFGVVHDGDDRWVYADYGHPECICFLGSRLVFVLPQSFSFLSKRHVWGVLFIELPIPSA